ncbi:NAD(P)-dependent oxidoreductase, partial [Nocardia cyriacigeorgica]
MRIAIFGATGTLGRHVLERALRQGHEVTALTRDASRVSTTHDNLRVLEGDVLDPAAVEGAVAGQDAVLISLGNGRKGV